MSDLSADTELKEKILSTEIEDLNLSIRSYNSLKRSGINSLSQIIDLGEDEVSKIRHLGKQQLNEIFDSTATFLGISRASLIQLTTPTVRETTQVDPIPEAETPSQIKKKLSPQDTRPLIIEIAPDTLPNLVEIIVPFSKKLMEVLEYEREFEVLKRRFGLEGSKTYTLQDIGNYYDLTRERVRQIEVHATSKIKKVLSGVSRLPRQRVPQNLIDEANEFFNLLQSKDTILTEQELIQITEERYKFKISPQKLNNLRLLLGVFEFRSLPRKLPGSSWEFVPAWIITKNIKEPLFRTAQAIYKVIYNLASPISSFDLKVQLINSKRKKQIEGKYIGLAVKLLPEIELVDNGDSFQIKFEYLTSLADQAYRILYESGKPIHLTPIQGSNSTKGARNWD